MRGAFLRGPKWAALVLGGFGALAIGACGGGAPAPTRAPATTAPGKETASCSVRHRGPRPERMGSSGAGATVALARWGERTVAYVADEDDHAVHVLDVDRGSRLSSARLGGRPSQLVMLPDGRLVVGIRDGARLEVLEPGPGIDDRLEPRCQVATAAEPVGLALSPDGTRVVVTSGWGRRLSAYAAGDLAPQWSVELSREPRSVLVTKDGARAIVAHAVGGKASIVDLAARRVRRVSLEAIHDHEAEELRRQLARTEESPASVLARMGERDDRPRRTSCQSFALASSLDGERIYLPQVLVDPGDRERRTVGYGEENVHTEVPSVAVLDAGTGYPLANSLRVPSQLAFASPDQREEHCILPRAAAVDAASGTLLVTCFGIDMVVAYDARSVDPVSAEKRRWRVAAGPSGIAIDEAHRRAVVWSQFDRTLNVIALEGPELSTDPQAEERSVRRFELPPHPERQLSVAEALGRALFHATGDTRIARDGRACASCHPDGRDDGLVWATPNGPRRTKLLAGMIAGTAPYSWDGDNVELRDHVSDTFERLAGVGGLRSVELRALMAYVESLPAPPRAPAGDPALVRRGAELFASEEVGCAKCHSGRALTDNKVHDVKSKARADRQGRFNTPSLKHLAGRAPYYHDGRFSSLRELLIGSDGEMGRTRHLSDRDLEALEAYLKQL